MNKISCNIIRDILPLYVDEVVSEDTRTMVTGHLEQCAQCRKQYESMKTRVEVPVENDIRPLKRFKTTWKKKKIILVCLTVLITVVCVSGAVFIYGQARKQALLYSQEYVVGKPGIRGDVDVQQYVSIDPSFDIGANKYGYPVFKAPEKALDTLKELFPDAIALIQTEFDLEELSCDTCQWYKIYSAQLETGTQEEKDQANFISRFLDIYENSCFAQ